MRERAANLLSLFASLSTLICCALPALFVALGAGAAFVSLLGAFPFLITLSRYKVPISLFALAMIVIAGIVRYKAARMPCPTFAEEACARARRRAGVVYYLSVSLFVFATLFTYVVPRFI